jgi:small subunit ribosomal protein S20
MLGCRSSGGIPLATHKSAEKRARQALKRRARNRQVRSRLRSAVKEVRDALATGREGAVESLRRAEGILRKAASKGVIPKKRASRQVARLTRAVKP